MGLMVDSSVFIRFEKSKTAVDFSAWESSEKVYISSLIASELLTGVYRADTPQRRQRRAEFVEAVIAGVSVLDFTVEVARVHARIHSMMATQGQKIGAHDLIIASTAIFHNLSILTDNFAEFSRVPGLRVVPFESNRR